jgi:multidrug efflux pump subunit AcrA (membrane-fusion protein)
MMTLKHSSPAVTPVRPAAPVPAVRAGQGAAASAPPRRPGLVLLAQAVVLEAGDFESAVAALGELLARELELDGIAVALRRGARLQAPEATGALAGSARAYGGHGLLAALHEALDQDTAVSLPPLADGPLAPVCAAHRHWLGRDGGSAASLPFHACGAGRGAAESAPAGVLCALRASGRGPLTNETLAALQEVLGFVGPLLALRHAARPRAPVKLARWWQRVAPPWARQPARAAAVLAAALALLLLAPLPAHVQAPARVEAQLQRTLVAPGAGFLRQAHARAGDRVRAGQLLVEMADEDLQLERQRLGGLLEQAQASLAEANGRADRAQFVIEAARVEEVRAQLDLVEGRIARARITAPFDAVVVRGDLDQQLGAPLAEGAELLTLAPAGEWRVVAEVDERHVARVAAGQRGELRLSALPWDTLPVQIEAVSPMARPGQAGNVFEVQARLLEQPADLRPGYGGRLRIRTGERPWLARPLEATARAVGQTWWRLWG